MSARNGTTTRPEDSAIEPCPAERELEPSEPGHAHQADAAEHRGERALDAAVRRIAEQARARRPGHDPSIRITRVDPSTLTDTPPDNRECAACGHAFRPGEDRQRDAGRQRLLVHTDSGCHRARRRAAERADQAAGEPEEATANAPTQAAPAADAEERLLHAWRDEAIVEWLRAEGPRTAREIASQFAIKQASNVIARLRSRGLIEKTGANRLSAGAKSGRPGAEYRAVEREPGPDGPPEAPSGAVVDPVARRADEIEIDGHQQLEATATAHATEPDATGRADARPARTMTLHEQLVVRYMSSLISSIERASLLRDAAPPEHVYERIERLLGIQDGAA